MKVSVIQKMYISQISGQLSILLTRGDENNEGLIVNSCGSIQLASINLPPNFFYQDD